MHRREHLCAVLTAWSDTIHSVLISEFRNIFWGSAVSNNLLLREPHFIYRLVNLPVRHVLAIKLREDVDFTVQLVKNSTDKGGFIVGKTKIKGKSSDIRLVPV